MRRAGGRLIRLVLVAIVFVTGLAAPAFAQQRSTDQNQRWYDVPALDQKKQWIQWVVAFLFTAGCAGIAFKNPHRSHLD